MLEFEYVKTPRQWLAIRRIRNNCRHFMTRDQDHITLLDQFKFYLYCRRSKDRVQPIIGYDNGRAVAYGLIKYESEYPWISGGVVNSARNKGVGKALFEYLIGCTRDRNGPIFLDVLISNQRAKRLYESLGFRDLSMRSSPFGQVMIMVKN